MVVIIDATTSQGVRDAVYRNHIHWHDGQLYRETLSQAFASIPDPRRKQGTRYSVAAILSLAVIAVLASHTSVLVIAEWPPARPATLSALGFRRDTTPHQTTFSACLRALTPPLWLR